MNSILIERLKADRNSIIQPVTQEDINIFQAECGIKLPKEYETFLLKVGAGDFTFGEVFDVVDRQGTIWIPDAIEHIRQQLGSSSELDNWETEYFPFGKNDAGWAFCFDMTEQLEHGFYSIVDVDLECGNGGPYICTKAGSLGEYIGKSFEPGYGKLVGPLLIASTEELPLVGSPEDSFYVRPLRNESGYKSFFEPCPEHVYFIGCHQKEVLHKEGCWYFFPRVSVNSSVLEDNAEVRSAFEQLSIYLGQLLDQKKKFVLLADWFGERSRLPQYQLTLGMVDIGGNSSEVIVGEPLRFD